MSTTTEITIPNAYAVVCYNSDSGFGVFDTDTADGGLGYTRIVNRSWPRPPPGSDPGVPPTSVGPDGIAIPLRVFNNTGEPIGIGAGSVVRSTGSGTGWINTEATWGPPESILPGDNLLMDVVLFHKVLENPRAAGNPSTGGFVFGVPGTGTNTVKMTVTADDHTLVLTIPYGWDWREIPFVEGEFAFDPGFPYAVGSPHAEVEWYIEDESSSSSSDGAGAPGSPSSSSSILAVSSSSVSSVSSSSSSQPDPDPSSSSSETVGDGCAILLGCRCWRRAGGLVYAPPSHWYPLSCHEEHVSFAVAGAVRHEFSCLPALAPREPADATADLRPRLSPAGRSVKVDFTVPRPEAYRKTIPQVPGAPSGSLLDPYEEYSSSSSSSGDEITREGDDWSARVSYSRPSGAGHEFVDGGEVASGVLGGADKVTFVATLPDDHTARFFQFSVSVRGEVLRATLSSTGHDFCGEVAADDQSCVDYDYCDG